MSDYIKREQAAQAFIDWAAKREIFGSLEYAEALEKIPAADVIPLGVELWSDRFEIKRRLWRSEDGEHMAESFMIVRKEE